MKIPDPSEFLDKFFEALDEKRIDYSSFQLDHIAYISSTFDDFNKIKSDFQKIADPFHETMVRGQNVVMLKLEKPWKYNNYIIEAIELVSPKKGETTKPRWEHVEFLLNEDFKSFMARYPNLDWDTKDMDEPDFPMIKLRLKEGMRVKFPKYSILEKSK